MSLAPLRDAAAGKAAPPAVYWNCFQKLVGGAKGVAQGARDVGKGINNGVKTYANEVKVQGPVRAVLKDAQPTAAGERAHGLWRPSPKLRALEEEKLAGARGVEPDPAAQAHPVQRAWKQVTTTADNAVQAVPRKASAKLFQDKTGHGYDLHLSYLPQALVRAGTKRIFGKEKELSRVITWPAGMVAGTVLYSLAYEGLDQVGKARFIDAVYAMNVGKDSHYDEIARNEKNGKITHEQARVQAYELYQKLKQRRQERVELGREYDKGANSMFPKGSLNAFEDWERGEILVDMKDVTGALNDYRYRHIGELAQTLVKNAGSDRAAILKAKDVAIDVWSRYQEAEKKYDALLDRDAEQLEKEPTKVLSDEDRVNRLYRLLKVQGVPVAGGKELIVPEFPQFTQDLLWMEPGLSKLPPKGFVYPKGQPNPVNPRSLAGLEGSEAAEERDARWRRMMDLVEINEDRIQAYRVIELSLKHEDKIPEQLKDDAFAQKVDALWRAKKIDRQRVQNTLMEYVDWQNRFREYEIIGMYPLREVPGGQTEKYTSEIKTLTDVQAELLRKLSR